MLVNKFGDQSKKVQCHAITVLMRVVTRFQGEVRDEVAAVVLREVSLFLTRPGTSASHRIYALGYLNKSLPVVVPQGSSQTKTAVLSIYFNLFNLLLHTEDSPE